MSPIGRPLSPAEERRHERWRVLRAQGFRAYVLRQGALMWGGPMFLAMGVLMPWINGDASRLEPRGLLLSALVFLLGGLLFGLLTWHFSEKRFLRHEPRANTQ